MNFIRKFILLNNKNCIIHLAKKNTYCKKAAAHRYYFQVICVCLHEQFYFNRSLYNNRKSLSNLLNHSVLNTDAF